MVRHRPPARRRRRAPGRPAPRGDPAAPSPARGLRCAPRPLGSRLPCLLRPFPPAPPLRESRGGGAEPGLVGSPGVWGAERPAVPWPGRARGEALGGGGEGTATAPLLPGRRLHCVWPGPGRGSGCGGSPAPQGEGLCRAPLRRRRQRQRQRQRHRGSRGLLGAGVRLWLHPLRASRPLEERMCPPRGARSPPGWGPGRGGARGGEYGSATCSHFMKCGAAHLPALEPVVYVLGVGGVIALLRQLERTLVIFFFKRQFVK